MENPELSISLDHPKGVFYPGNEVAGTVILKLSPETSTATFIGLRLTCIGEGQVYFTDRSAGFRRRFSNEESYISEEFYLFGDGKREVVVPGGDNEYSFKVSLPDNIPCSFEGRYGRVRYRISVFLEGTESGDVTQSIPFTVAAVLDLNKDSLATLPISEENSKVFIGQPEPINMLVTLPVRGFVPGQTIPVKIALNNPCDIEIKKLRIVFKKVITYHAQRKSRRHKEIIVEIELPVSRDSTRYETGVDVPAVPPTGMVFCTIIDVWYTLKVEACVEANEWYMRMLQKNLKTRMRIVVGSVPLKHYETPEEEEEEEEKIDELDETLGGRNIDDTEAKLYEESKIYPSSKPHRDDPTGNDEDENGPVDSYAPLYRVYTFNKRKESNPPKSTPKHR